MCCGPGTRVRVRVEHLAFGLARSRAVGIGDRDVPDRATREVRRLRVLGPDLLRTAGLGAAHRLAAYRKWQLDRGRNRIGWNPIRYATWRADRARVLRIWPPTHEGCEDGQVVGDDSSHCREVPCRDCGHGRRIQGRRARVRERSRTHSSGQMARRGRADRRSGDRDRVLRPGTRASSGREADLHRQGQYRRHGARRLPAEHRAGLRRYALGRHRPRASAARHPLPARRRERDGLGSRGPHPLHRAGT